VGENFQGVDPATTQNPDLGTNQAAVSAVPLRENTMLSFLECGSDEDLEPQDVQECEDTAVGDMRADSPEAKEAKEAYRDLFGSYAERQARVAERKAELAAALEAGDTHAPVLASIRKLFGAVETMGMSEESMASFQMAVITALQPAGRSLEEIWALLAASY
jgi:hypothetical protein